MNKPISHSRCNSQESFNPTVRGIHCIFQTTSNKAPKDFDEESLASVDSEELEREEDEEIIITDELPDDMNKAIPLRKASPLLEKIDIPQKLHFILEACEISFA